jgi:hypothetical protein
VEEAVVRPTRWIVVVLAIAALAVAGCERVSERDGGDARQLVTRDFGAALLVDAAARDGGSALDALRAVAAVETGYGGGFVQEIDGIGSDPSARRDWFYWVNGVSPGRGADQITLRPGDAVWWDHRPWAGLMDAWAVVGLWPQPFVNGYPDAPETVAADPPLDAPLRAAGAPVGSGDSPWRVRVGADADLRRRDAAWARAMRDAEAAGLTVRIADDGVEALAADGATWRRVPDGRAVAAAVLTGTDPEDGGVLLAVAGIDRSAAVAAARRIAADPGVLARRFAVVFDATGAPVAAGGGERR